MDAVRELFREYAEWLEVDLCFQSFEEELASLPGKYARPNGRLLLADADSRVAGGVGLRPMAEPGACEMKRLYVRDWAKGRGIGRALVDQVVAEARAEGYRIMRLDTLLERMPQANHLYQQAGFRDTPAYYDNPVGNVRYMELQL